MGNKRRVWDKQKLFDAVKNNHSLAGVLRELGMRVGGGNYNTIKSAIREFGLDTSHWDAKKASGVSTGGRTIPMKDILVRNSSYNSTNTLRNRLVKEGYFKEECNRCGLSKWLGNKIPLELNHINGDRNDNRLCNLEIICPNCHALTENYRGRNKRIAKERRYCKRCGNEIGKGRTGLCSRCYFYRKFYNDDEKYCKNCKMKISKWAKNGLCKGCAQKNRYGNLNRPSGEQLLKEVEELGYCGTGRKYGVTDNAIRKWLGIKK